MTPAPTGLTLIALAALAVPGVAAAQTSPPPYFEACSAGDMEACNLFGLMYQHGEGVAQDPARALNLYVLSCDGGVADACRNIALLFRRALATSDDFDLVQGHYADACDGGDASACDFVETLDDIDIPEPGELFTRRGLIATADTRAVLDNALVTVVGEDRHVVSDASGQVALGRLSAGEYTIRVERAGYEPADVRIGVPGSEDFLVTLERRPPDQSSGSGGLVGRVTDDSGNGLSDVDVSVVGRPGVRAITGPNGRFQLADQAPGLLEVRLDRLGYTPRTATLVVQPASTTELQVEMPTDAIELEPIRVEIRAPSLERAGFYRRRDRPGGRYWDQEQLERLNPTFPTDILQGTPGLVVDDPNRQVLAYAAPAYAYNRRGGTACRLSLYIDGVFKANPDLLQVQPANIAAMEVYVGADTPLEYSSSDQCGAVVVWQKR